MSSPHEISPSPQGAELVIPTADPLTVEATRVAGEAEMLKQGTVEANKPRVAQQLQEAYERESSAEAQLEKGRGRSPIPNGTVITYYDPHDPDKFDNLPEGTPVIAWNDPNPMRHKPWDRDNPDDPSTIYRQPLPPQTSIDHRGRGPYKRAYSKGIPSLVVDGKVISGAARVITDEDKEPPKPAVQDLIRERLPNVPEASVATGGLVHNFVRRRRARRLGKTASEALGLAEDVGVQRGIAAKIMEGTAIPADERQRTPRQERAVRDIIAVRDELREEKGRQESPRYLVGRWDNPGGTQWSQLRDAFDQPVRDRTGRRIRVSDLGVQAKPPSRRQRLYDLLSRIGTNRTEPMRPSDFGSRDQYERVANIRHSDDEPHRRYTNSEVKLEKNAAHTMQDAQHHLDHAGHVLHDAAEGRGFGATKKVLDKRIAAAEKIAGRIKKSDQKAARRAQQGASQRRASPQSQGHRLN